MTMDVCNFFVYSRSAGHLLNAWECREDAEDAARDPSGWGAPRPGVTDYKVYTRIGLERLGITIANNGTVTA
jgi:hypothetical protein